MAHWTEKNIDSFVNSISFDFVTQLAKRLETLPLSKGAFAEKLGITVGRVSQIFNNPGNLTLKKIAKYAKAVGMKVSIVAYEDKDDPNNERGPINSEIFATCWERAGRPSDFFSLNATTTSALGITIVSNTPVLSDECLLSFRKAIPVHLEIDNNRYVAIHEESRICGEGEDANAALRDFGNAFVFVYQSYKQS